MKKILQLSTIFACLFSICLGLAGCDAKMVKINVDLDTIKTEYFVGEEQETYENAKVFVIYSDNNQKLIASDNEDLSFSSISTESTGEKTLVVQYKKLKQEIKITVKQRLDKPISAIDIVEESVSKTSYHIDDEVDSYSNLKVKLSFADGTEDAVVFASEVPNLTVTKPSTGLTGTSSLSVSCQEKTDSINITITEKEIESISLAAEGAVFIKGQELPKENIYITVRYTDNSTRAITHNKDSFDVVSFNVDLTSSGYQDVSATYKNVTSNILENTPVYSSIYDTYIITEFEAPKFVQTYRTNIKRASDKNPFKVGADATDSSYAVGHQNPFEFLPTIKGCASLNDLNNIVTIPQYKSIVTLKEKVGGSWVIVTENINSIVSIDDENSKLQFTAGAIGREFEITVQPYFDPSEENTQTFRFTVHKGYNIYHAKELSLIDNVNTTEVIKDHDTPNGVWTDFKTEHNLNFVVDGGVYLHCDLSLTSGDVAPNFFFKNTNQIPNDGEWSTPTVWEGSVFKDSLIDETYLYQRSIPAGQSFNFNGNYFSINASTFPLISCFKNWGSGSNNFTHGSIIWTEGFGSFNVSNLEIFGNAKKDETEKSAGGLVFLKVSRGSEANVNNLQTKALFISFFAHESDELKTTTLNIENTISIDNFSNMIFSHGKTLIDIKTSVFKDAGGPLFIASHDEPDEDENSGLLYGTITIDKDTVLENHVSGQEAWFIINNATPIVNKLKLLDDALSATPRSIYGEITIDNSKVEVLNLIGLIMNENGPMANLPNGYAIQGKIAIETETPGIVNGSNLIKDPALGGDLIHSLAQNSPAPILQGGGQTLIYAGPSVGLTKLVLPSPDPVPATQADILALLSAPYLGVSYPIDKYVPEGGTDEVTPGRIGIVFGLFNRA